MNILDLKRSLLPMRGYSGYGSDSEGGASEGVGGEGTSAGDASAAGGDSMGGSYGGGGSNSDALAAQANALADALSVDPLDALMASTGAFGTAPSYGAGEVSPGGYGYNTLGMLNDLGYGGITGVNPNNPTQSIAEAMASQATHGFLNKNIPALASMINPAFGAAITSLNQLQGLVTGQVSLGQAAVNAALGQVASKLGVPVGVVTGVLNGNIGQAVSAETSGAIKGALTSALSEITGLPSSVVSLGLNATGVSSAIGPGISSTVNSALGISPDKQTNTSSIAASIDSALSGFTSGAGATGGASAGAGGADGSGFIDWSNYDGRAGYTGATGALPTSPTPAGTGASAADLVRMLDTTQKAQITQPQQAIQPNAAAIKYLRDISGPMTPDFLTRSAPQFSSGGSVEELLQLLRS